MIRGSPWSRRALSERRGPRKSPSKAGHELKLAGPSSCSTCCPGCTIPWRRARAAGLSYACAGAGSLHKDSAARRGSAAARGCAAAARGSGARRSATQGTSSKSACLIPSLWRPSAIWHCCGAAPAEGAALAVNDEEWLLQQHGVPPSPAGGEKWPRGRRDGEANPI